MSKIQRVIWLLFFQISAFTFVASEFKIFFIVHPRFIFAPKTGKNSLKQVFRFFYVDILNCIQTS